MRFLAALTLLSCTAGGADSGDCELAGVTEGLGIIESECACLEPRLEVGTGERSFIPLEDGDDLEIVHGPQGGWHLLAAAWAENMRDVVQFEIWAEFEETGERFTTQMSYRAPLVCEDTCVGVFTDIFMFIDVNHFEDFIPPTTMACESVLMGICASDHDGREACGEKRVRAVPDPDDVKEGLAAPCE